MLVVPGTVYTRKGFSLLELLVVMAVIGLLAGGLFVAFGSSRKIGKDARIIATLEELRLVLEASRHGDYPALDDIPATAPLLADIDANNGGQGVLGGEGGSTVMIASVLYEEGSAGPRYYCVDTLGFAGKVDSVPTGSTCPSVP
jgi:prepilin-type N-terminal cleavage/methylation domain-containing protein